MWYMVSVIYEMYGMQMSWSDFNPNRLVQCPRNMPDTVCLIIIHPIPPVVSLLI